MEIIVMGKQFSTPFKVKDDVLTLTSFDDIPNDRIMFELTLRYHKRLFEMLEPGDIFFNSGFPEATVTIDLVVRDEQKDIIKVKGHLNDDVINQ